MATLVIVLAIWLVSISPAYIMTRYDHRARFPHLKWTRADRAFVLSLCLLGGPVSLVIACWFYLCCRMSKYDWDEPASW
jgi:hypothetical protein